MLISPSRLKVQLQNTGLQNKDSQLYQLLYQMLGVLEALNGEVSVISGGGGTTIINNLLGFPPLSMEDGGGDGEIGPPGVAGADGANGMVPYYVAPDETFSIPEYKQALFSMTIDNEGIIEIDGYLIEVDGGYTPPMLMLVDTTNQTPGATTPTKVTFNTDHTVLSFTVASSTITFHEAGYYAVLGTFQIGETSNGKVNVDVWLRQNGVDIPYSNNRNYINLTTDAGMLTIDELGRFEAGDTLEVYMSVDDAAKGAGLISLSPAGEPVIASAMLNIKKVGD